MFKDNWRQLTVWSMKAERFILMALFFTIPLSPKLNTFCIIFWAIVSIISYKRIEFKCFIRRKELVLYSLVYVCLLIGLFYTVSPENGLSKIQTQVSLIIFPLILGRKNITSRERIRYINSFVLGVAFTVLICLLFNFYRYTEEESFYVLDAFNRKQHIFFYFQFSQFLDLHPSYFSLYLGFSVFYLLTTSAERLGIHKNLKYFLILLLLMANFLTASKGGLFTFLLLTLIFYLYNVFYKRQKKSLWMLLLLVGGTVLVFSMNTMTSNRFLQAFTTLDKTFVQNKSANESTGIRLALWRLSLEASKEVFLFGHGTGSVVKVLNDSCITYNSFSVCEGLRNKNCHNQYLNFLVSNGIFALLLFLGALGYGLLRSLKDRDVISLFFLLFMMLNFFFESMLQRERGIVFFMLFTVLFTISQKPIITK